MIITYSDGKAVEAALLTRSETTIRVAIAGSDDVTEFRKIDGKWVSENCEPAQIEFAWPQEQRPPVISEADCCWSADQAAQLLYGVLSESDSVRGFARFPMAVPEAPEALWFLTPVADLVN